MITIFALPENPKVQVDFSEGPNGDWVAQDRLEAGYRPPSNSVDKWRAVAPL
jgi:hypothetical protein